MILILPSAVSKLDRRHTVRPWEATCWQESGEGVEEEPNHTTPRKPGYLLIMQYFLLRHFNSIQWFYQHPADPDLLTRTCAKSSRLYAFGLNVWKMHDMIRICMCIWVEKTRIWRCSRIHWNVSGRRERQKPKQKYRFWPRGSQQIWLHTATALQGKFHLCIPFLGIARPQS